ncbi:MAG: arylsulfatase, partial [Bacteroidetes bacterium]|nr:arylsulfatase [Bacteroidota bacterium]
LQSGVLIGYDSMLIKDGRTTIASLLKESGYQTACIGKWHLGLEWQKDAFGKVDFSKPITDGPLQVGFDYFYGISASLDMPPYFYIENQKITATSIDSISANSGKGFWRAGPIGNDFRHEEVLTTMANKAVDYIKRESNSGIPFFLYLAFPSPHTPILPTAPYRGISKTNAYGDFVLMTDDMVGKVLNALKEAGIDQNTMIIFTSDNGPSPSANFKELAEAGHRPSYIYRGAKADIYEGGHRIPFIVKWPGHVKAGTVCDRTICLTDFLATAADVVHRPLNYNEGEDSYSLMPLLLQKNNYERTSIIHHSIDGNFSIRTNQWKLIFARGSGGWSEPTEAVGKKKNLPKLQLYRLNDDIKETKNVASTHPDVVRTLSRLTKAIVENGRSTKGRKQKNDVRVDYKKTKDNAKATAE